jgi:heat shock protein HslJ
MLLAVVAAGCDQQKSEAPAPAPAAVEETAAAEAPAEVAEVVEAIETPPAALEETAPAAEAPAEEIEVIEAVETPPVAEVEIAIVEGPIPVEGSPADETALTLEALAEKKFELRQVDGADYHAEQRPFISFDAQGLVVGKVCNNFRGPVKVEGGLLTLQSAAAATQMLCPVNGLSDLEAKLFDMLNQGAEISLEGAALTLKRGENVFVFEAATDLAE